MSDISHENYEPWRMKIVYAGLVLVFLIFAIRLFSLQIIKGEEYLEKADENRISTITLHAERGVIYDRNGFVLASNAPAYNVVITPGFLPDDDGDIEEIYRELSDLIGVPVSNGEITDETARLFTPCKTDFGIKEIVFIGGSIAPYDPVQIRCDVPRDVAMVVEENQVDWKGVTIEIVPIREYPTGDLTSEVIGFLGPIPASLEDYYAELGFVAGKDKLKNVQRIRSNIIQKLQLRRPPHHRLHRRIKLLACRLDQPIDSRVMGEVGVWLGASNYDRR